MASVLCIAMALSLYPQQAAMAEEQKPEEGTNPVVCEQADYDGVEPTWGDWTEKEGQPGDWIVTAVLNCKKCGGKASGHSQEMEVAILQEETKPASCTEEGLRTFKASVERNGQKLENPTPKEVAIPAKGHTYGEPVWNWIMTGEENTATAEFACKACQNKCAENAKVESVSHQEATCTAPGKTVYKATVTIPEAEQSQFEKASYENTKPMEEAAKGHKYGEPVWNWIMTGEEKTATAEFTCKACQNKRTENAKVESDSHQEATCTTPGKTVYKATIAIPEPEKSQFEKVSYEDTKTIEEAAKGHAYGAPVWRWSLTGEEKTAIAEFRCKVCQDKRTENAKMESNVQEATCTTPGGIFYKATVAIPEADQPQFEKSSYEDKRTIEEEPAKGHAYGEPVWGEWSVDEQTGECQITATFTCANGCGETIEKTVTGREISRKNPTCTENGSVSYQAQVGIGVPGETALSPVYEKLIPTEGHGYAISGSAWRWDAEKSAYYVEVTTVCAKCQEENVLAVPAQKEVKQATCTEAGEIAYTAKVQVGSVEYPMSMAIWMPAEGHEYGEPEWGLSEDHKTVTAVMTCTKCAEGTEGHRMEGSAEPKEEIVPANCTQAGKATYMASVVIGGKTYTKQIELAIPAAGHKMKKTDAKAATCDKDGNTAYSACEVCKKYFSDEEGKREIAKDSWVVKKKGHKIKSVVAAKATKTKAGSLKRKCKVCGKVEEIGRAHV